jgi:hypothetical protein
MGTNLSAACRKDFAGMFESASMEAAFHASVTCKREIHKEKDVKLSVVGDLHTNRATGGPIRSTAAQMQLGYNWWRPRLQREDEGFRCTVPHHIPPVSSVHAVHDTIALCGGTSPGRRGNKLAPSRPQPVVRFSAFAATSADLPACSTH